MAGRGAILPAHLPHFPENSGKPRSHDQGDDSIQFQVGHSIREVEKAYIFLTLGHVNNNKVRAAEETLESASEPCTPHRIRRRRESR